MVFDLKDDDGNWTHVYAKPCPFCGSDDLELNDWSDPEDPPEERAIQGERWEICCAACAMTGPPGGPILRAIERWNKRHDQADRQANEYVASRLRELIDDLDTKKS